MLHLIRERSIFLCGEKHTWYEVRRIIYLYEKKKAAVLRKRSTWYTSHNIKRRHNYKPRSKPRDSWRRFGLIHQRSKGAESRAPRVNGSCLPFYGTEVGRVYGKQRWWGRLLRAGCTHTGFYDSGVLCCSEGVAKR